MTQKTDFTNAAFTFKMPDVFTIREYEKSTALPVPISTKLTVTQQHYVQTSYANFTLMGQEVWEVGIEINLCP